MQRMKYTIEHRLPKVEEYRYLCESVGWRQIMNLDAAERALNNSVAGVVALNETGLAVAMGRIVGDGAIYFYIQDIAVDPQYQRSGLGTAVLMNLLQHIERTAPEKAFIGLFSVPDALGFYEKFTLEKRDLVGLFTVKEILASGLSSQ